MRLLITRPRADAEAISEVLRNRGHATVIAPLMEVHVHEGPPLALDGVQAVLATSALGGIQGSTTFGPGVPSGQGLWFQFGVVAPRAYAGDSDRDSVSGAAEPWKTRTECLVECLGADGSAWTGTGSDIPVPRLSKVISRAKVLPLRVKIGRN